VGGRSDFGMTVAYLSDKSRSRIYVHHDRALSRHHRTPILCTVHGKREVGYTGPVLYTVGVISVLPVFQF